MFHLFKLHQTVWYLPILSFILSDLMASAVLQIWFSSWDSWLFLWLELGDIMICEPSKLLQVIFVLCPPFDLSFFHSPSFFVYALQVHWFELLLVLVMSIEVHHESSTEFLFGSQDWSRTVTSKVCHDHHVTCLCMNQSLFLNGSSSAEQAAST